MVNVTFTPTVKGARNAFLQFTDGAPASPQTVGLTGTGIGTAPPAVSLSPITLTFLEQAVGTTSTPMIVTLTNTGDLTLNVNGIVFTGANPTDFGDTNNCSGLQSGQSCTIKVTFTPGALGARSATLSIFDNAADSPQSVPVSGTGTPPGLGLVLPSGSSDSATVQPGGTATYTLAIGGQGVSGTATLACTGAPATVTCSVPSSDNVSATTATTFNVTAATMAPTNAVLRRKSSTFAWAWATVLIGFVLVPVSGRSRRLRRNILAMLPLLLILFLASCGGDGGGGGGGSAAGGTQAGTYDLTVTATMGSANQSQVLKLIVK